MRLIDADALMKELEREVELADDWKTAHEIVNVVKYFPTIEPEQKKGKWKWDAEEGYWCSECKEYVYGCTAEIMEGSYKFCPFCGSENEEDQWTEKEQ